MSGGRTTGEKLKDAMARAGVSQHQLARLANVSQSNVSKYYNSLQDQPYETVVNLYDTIPADIAEKLGIEPKEDA